MSTRRIWTDTHTHLHITRASARASTRAASYKWIHRTMQSITGNLCMHWIQARVFFFTRKDYEKKLVHSILICIHNSCDIKFLNLITFLSYKFSLRVANQGDGAKTEGSFFFKSWLVLAAFVLIKLPFPWHSNWWHSNEQDLFKSKVNEERRVKGRGRTSAA